MPFAFTFIEKKSLRRDFNINGLYFKNINEFDPKTVYLFLLSWKDGERLAAYSFMAYLV